MAYIDYKVSIWRRVKVKDEVAEDPKALQELIDLIHNNETIHFDIEDMVDSSNDELLLDTEECLYTWDNNDQSTLELFNEEGILLSNNQPNE